MSRTASAQPTLWQDGEAFSEIEVTTDASHKGRRDETIHGYARVIRLTAVMGRIPKRFSKAVYTLTTHPILDQAFAFGTSAYLVKLSIAGGSADPRLAKLHRLLLMLMETALYRAFLESDVAGSSAWQYHRLSREADRLVDEFHDAVFSK